MPSGAGRVTRMAQRKELRFLPTNSHGIARYTDINRVQAHGNSPTSRPIAPGAVARARGRCEQRQTHSTREDYLLPLKALSLNSEAAPIVRAMTRIQRWSGAFDYGLPFAALRAALHRCHAFEEDLQRFKLVFPGLPASH